VTSNLTRLKATIWVIRVLVVLAAAWTLSAPFELFGSPERLTEIVQGSMGLDPEKVVLTDRVRMLSLCTILPRLLIGLYLLYELWRLFDGFMAARFFETDTLRHFRRFSIAGLVAAVLSPVENTVLSVVFTMDAPVGQRTLLVGVGGSDLHLVLVGLVLVAISTVLSEAARIAEENRGFV
jgi:hypothetical protein